MFTKTISCFLILCFVALPTIEIAAQKVAPPIAKADTASVNNQMDILDLIKLVFRKKNAPVKKKRVNVNGPYVTTIPYPAYSIATGVAAALPFNISFYTNLKEKGNLSFFNNNFQYTQYNQILALSISNLYFGHDKWLLIGDWRYYKFPTYTFGLGSRTSLADADEIKYSHLRFYETVLRTVAKNTAIGIGYHLDYHWQIRDINAEQGSVTDFQRYGLNRSSISSALSVNFIYDSRNNTNNPESGAYFNMQFRTNLKVLGSSQNWNSVIVDARKYIPLPVKWRAGFAFWGLAWFTMNGQPPYLDLPATGWDNYNNTGRGYAMGRFRGRHMLYLETEFRFNILRSGLLGGVVFANLQTVSEWPRNNFVSAQPGYGIGLRIKMNKRTNTNSAVDYGFGSGGSRGLAFNFNEVF